jgi:hypothetical protein
MRSVDAILNSRAHFAARQQSDATMEQDNSYEHDCLKVSPDQPDNFRQRGMPPKKEPTGRRQLLDYTIYRSDGSKAPPRTNMLDDDLNPKPSIKGVPACTSLDASLETVLSRVDSDTDERIDFFLKISPRSARRSSRISTLDTVYRHRLSFQRNKAKSLGDHEYRETVSRRCRRSCSTPVFDPQAG